MMFYSPSAAGFFSAAAHGARRISIPDPEWQRPTIEIVDPTWIDDGGSVPPLVFVPDMDAIQPSVEMDNPDCKIPADAVEITAEEYAALLAGLSSGQRIVADVDGRPMLADRTGPTAAEIWQLIKAERDRRRFEGGVQVAGHWFQSTAIATGEYSALALLSNGVADVVVLRANWRTMDGATVDMTAGLVKQILAAGFAQVAAIDDAAQAHRAAMEASADPSAYDYTAGWPPVFGE